MRPHRLTSRAAAAALALALAGCAGRGAPAAAAPARPAPVDIAYELGVLDPSAHIFEIALDLRRLTGDSVLLQLPVWSPGRYANMGFARNVFDFAASTPDAHAVAWDKINGSLWRLRTAGAPAVRVRYKVFANNLSGTFSVADTAHINWNGASLFMYVVGHKPDPVRLRVSAPDGWALMSGDADSPDQRAFSFVDYDHLIDTPTEIAPAAALAIDTFRVDDRLYRVVVHHNGPDAGQRARFVRDVERIVRYENRVVGPPPLKRYTFLFNIGYAGGDGMEHLYSTQIINREPWTTAAPLLPGISSAAHEYFHVWNVKRIRPIALGPFDYTTEQYQPSLWVAEGWTQYYGEIALERAGIVGRDDYYRTLGRVVTYNLRTPARKTVSARAASFEAPFWDGRDAPMQTARPLEWINYYFKGEALALLLDLEIRARTSGRRSLDDALRELKRLSWDAPNASYYLQGRGYTETDVEHAASTAAGVDLHPWFERYVGGTEELPVRETLELAGLALVTPADTSGDYIVRERPDATPEQRRLRDQWLSGTTSTEP